MHPNNRYLLVKHWYRGKLLISIFGIIFYPKRNINMLGKVCGFSLILLQIKDLNKPQQQMFLGSITGNRTVKREYFKDHSNHYFYHSHRNGLYLLQLEY